MAIVRNHALAGEMSSRGKRARMTSQMEEMVDRLSELPQHVIDHILSLLPIKDAVKTSILSRNWRYRWTSLPDLVFDDRCTPTAADAQSSNSKLQKIVSDLLLIHSGPIRGFVISHKKFHADAEISRWIYYLSRASLKVLSLNFFVGPRCKIPSILFSCQDLVRLCLHCCSISLPSGFGGFKHLKTMDFADCVLSQDGLERLISSCPLLDTLLLSRVDHHISRLHITAPKLRALALIGAYDLKDVSFGANSLAALFVSIPVDNNEDGQAQINKSHSLLGFFGPLPLIIKLNVGKYLLKGWCCGELPQKLPGQCLYLKTLSVDIDFGSEKEISAVLCLLRSCPILRELQLLTRQSSGQRNADAGYGFWERHSSPCSLLQLQLAAVFGISGTGLELGLIRFILGNSPLLKHLFTVEPATPTSNLLRDLLLIERASPHAQVVHLDAHDTMLRKLGWKFLSMRNDYYRNALRLHQQQ